MAHYGKKRGRDDYDDTPPSHKRGRYSDPGMRGPRGPDMRDPEQKLESLITRVGEKSQKSLESNLEILAEMLTAEMSNFKDKILRTICNCVVTLTEKTSIYSTLVGILNGRKFDFGEELLDMLVEDLKSALVLNHFDKAKQLVRFLADLVNAKVVASSSILNLFEAFITVTYEQGVPQVRSDWYVQLVLSSLPWVGAELLQRKRVELDRLLGSLEGYMSKRSTPYLPALQVWTSDYPHSQRDSLELLWLQLKKMRENEWKERTLLRPYVAFDSEIGGAYSHPLPTIHLPAYARGVVYPLPTVVFRMYSSEDLQYAQESHLPSVDSIDRFLAEETVRNIIQSHAGNRKECATALIHFSADKTSTCRFAADYIIVEVLFGFIFQLPSPPQVPVYYFSLLIELCKGNPATFPQILSQSAALLFTRLEKMNSICISRSAQWFSYNLSNFKYQWDWNSWSSCFTVPPDDASVRFVSEIFERSCRLASYEVFSDLIEEPFTSLMPPEPSPVFKYSDNTEEPLPEQPVAKHLLEAIRAKEPEDALRTVLESVTDTVPSLSSDPDKLADTKITILTQCVLHVGSKTISHCFLALFKFRSLFSNHAKTESTKLVILKEMAEFYAHDTQRQVLIVDQLIRKQIVDCMTVINWLFSPSVLPLFTRQYVWDTLEATIRKSSSAKHTSLDQLADIRERLEKVSGLDEVAMGSADRQELEDRLAEVEEKREESERMEKDVFVAVFSKFVSVLSEHLSRCEQGGVDHESAWFLCTLDNCRQLLVQHHTELIPHTASLESLVFTEGVDTKILEVFHQFQALL